MTHPLRFRASDPFRRSALAILVGAALLGGAPAPDRKAKLLDGFDDLSTWKPVPSDGVSLALAADQGHEGRAMRMDFDFHGHGGWAAVRRSVSLELPENYRITLRLRGEAPANTLEIKLIDPSGDNVWWTRRQAWEFPRDWTEVVVDKARLEFAWGPSQTRVLDRVGAIEVTIAAWKGGKGSVWLDELTFEDLPPPKPSAIAPVLRASSSLPGQGAEQAMDGKADTAWHATPGGRQWLTMDFGDRRELGGLLLDWAPEAHAAAYSVQTSADGRSWKTVRAVRRGNGGKDYLRLPDAEGRFVRLSLTEAAGPSYGLREIQVEPRTFGDTSVAIYQKMARGARRGLYPRYLLDEFSYWTTFGVDRDEANKPLLTEDGVIETPAGFTLEPFLRLDGRLLTWADVETEQTLEERSLPLPASTWKHPKFSLRIAPFAAGTPAAPVLYACYRLRNASEHRERAQLYVAVRPLRATPPWHSLNIPEPTAPIRTLTWRQGQLLVDGSWRIVPLSRPTGVAAASFDEGDASDLFDETNAAAPADVEDRERHASAVFRWDLSLESDQEREVSLAIPLHGGAEAAPPASRLAGLGSGAAAHVAAERKSAADYWRSVVGHVAIDIPAAQDLVDTVRASVAYILVGRDGAAIRGGPRNYDRSWIRDGSLSSAMLLRFGLADEVASYIRWFAPYQFKDGKVPCCVDTRGADPVPEHDSHGQWIYLVAAYARLTGDLELPAEMWPRVELAAGYLDSLRRQRRTEAYRAPDKLHFFGLLPESISHEGYSAKPMHSYWDDFWGLRGLKDAVWLAERLGKTDAASRIARIRDEFSRDLHASIERTMSFHKIAYIPGAADIGDYDPTSTTIAVEPAGEMARLPRSALLATFERYWEEAEARMEGRRSWTRYTPYEVRQVGTFVRLGWRERAHRLLGFFLDDRRPPGWKNWAEVVAEGYRDPVYLGDIPHMWVASDYVRSFLDMLAYEREEDEALVVCAGVPETWLEQGIRIQRLHTFWGTLDLAVRRDGSRVVTRIGEGLRVPPGGIVLALPGTARTATVNGRAAPITGGRVTVREAPAEVVFTR
jgi:hypothetical protein